MAGYTDKDLQVASALAYVDFNSESFKNHPDWTISQHLQDPANESFKQAFIDSMGSENYDKFVSGEYSNWKIVDSQNNNGWDGNGFAACTVDTGDGNAIVGFRGSEGNINIIDDPSSLRDPNLYDDWLTADAGLLNSTQTSQQQYAEEYLKRINEQYGDRFDGYSITGHSLGGNLAEHATLTASDEIAAKINRCLNLDGPGYSDEYLAAHADEIAKNAHLVDHYQASAVGAMLNSVPGTNYSHISVKDGTEGFDRHSMSKWEFDDYGNAKPGQPDEFSIQANAITNTLDDITTEEGLGAAKDLLWMTFSGLIAGESPEEMAERIQEIYDSYYNNYSSQAQNRGGYATEFSVSSPVLVSTSETASQCSRNLSQDAMQIDDIKSEISLILKAASFFTLSFKLKKSVTNLEKLAAKSGKMSESASKIAELYNNTETNILSNSGV
ncbi:MAG: DUF2974 domain-containing protein [Clostridia bacterium]|nr:DUF2974 domain-containing protein [Clostridia bacterium]